MAKQIAPDEFERIVAAYLGGKLRDGAVPVGAAMVPAEVRDELVKHVADKGFALSFEKHENERLIVATLATLEAIKAPTAVTTPSTSDLPAAPSELEHVEPPKEG